MTDDEIVQTIQTAIDDLATALTAETNRALHNLTEWVAVTLTQRPAVSPPPLGEISLRLEPGPSTKRVERDKAGNITRVIEEAP